jgi:hypothetical protein
MNPRVVNVIAKDDYTLTLTFTNGEVGQFDVTPYLDKGIFQELQNKSYFKQVSVTLGTVQWPHEQDFCPDTLYEASRKIAVAAD